MQPTDLSVVIPNLHSPLIDRVLDALRGQTVTPREIIVVGLDRPGLVHEDERVRMLSTDRPVSPATARNLGARTAQGSVICFIDADCLARPDWLARLLTWHQAGHTIVGGGVAVERDDYWRLCDNVVAFWPFLEESALGTRPYLPSLNFSIRRDLLLEFGGFDERFPRAAGEDTDLCFRLRRAGHTLWFDPQAAIVHRHLRSSPGDLWRHLAMYGKVYQEIYPDFPDLLGDWWRLRAGARRPSLLRVLAPWLALTDLAKRLLRQPWLWRYWQCAPGFLLGGVAWHNGAAEGLQERLEHRRAGSYSL